MNRFSSRPAALLPALLPCALAALACQDGCSPADGVRLYHTERIAPSLTEEGVKKLDHLGPTLVDRGVNFGVYSQRATRVDLLLFDDPESARPTKEFTLQRVGDVWNLYVEGVGLGQHYGFRAFGPNWPYDPRWECGTIHGFAGDWDAAGNRFNPNKLLFDPYGKALHRDFDWTSGNSASGPLWRATCDYAAAMKSVIVESRYSWSAHEQDWRAKRAANTLPGHDWHQSIVYEVHVKGFTKDPASGVEHPGTYRGFGEKAAWLKDLGVTAVELLPVFEKPLDGGYWGYNTFSFFVPEISYAYGKDVTTGAHVTRQPWENMDDFKWMVDQLHQQGIEVWLDVVYNHLGEGGLWRQMVEMPASSQVAAQFSSLDPEPTAGIYSYRGLDNWSYYALDPDNMGRYWNNTGVGTETRANHKPMRRLIMDSLRYWAVEMHVDGFRFDLAPVLGARDLDPNYWDSVELTVVQDIIDDPVLQSLNTRIVAEPWAAGGVEPVKVGKFPKSSTRPEVAWGEWNSKYRDWWREFVNYDEWTFNRQEWDVDGGGVLTGTSKTFEGGGRRPYHSVNFVTCHDGFTMYDLVSYATKQNGCSPINPVCCPDFPLGGPSSPWCQPQAGESNNRSRAWNASAPPWRSDDPGEKMKRQVMRAFFTAMMISHGTPMILGGDEFLRTQLGNNNAFATQGDNDYNWYTWGAYLGNDDWGLARQRMHDFVRKIVRLRKEHEYAFAPATYGGGAPFAWRSEANGEANWGSRRMMIHYHDSTKGPQLAVLINMERYPVTFTLPTGVTWQRLVDTQGYFDEPGIVGAEGRDQRLTLNATLDAPETITGGTYGVPETTIVILEEKR